MGWKEEEKVMINIYFSVGNIYYMKSENFLDINNFLSDFSHNRETSCNV